MEQQYFYQVHTLQDIYHSQLEGVLNSLARHGGKIVNVDQHSKTLYVTMEYTKEEWKQYRYMMEHPIRPMHYNEELR